VVPHVEQKSKVAEAQFVFAMCLLFGLAVVAVYTGVAAIVGAFLAGMALAESTGQRVRDLASGVAEFLVPFFLVGIGMRVDLMSLSKPSTAILCAAIVAAAVVSKFIGCGLGAWRMGKTEALRVGVGMIPRGEVGMVVAQIGLGYGILTQSVYSVIVFMSVATTIIAPSLIRLAYRTVSTARAEEELEEVFRIS
jgi:Kef-type K+ transport system membrane component KefB